MCKIFVFTSCEGFILSVEKIVVIYKLKILRATKLEERLSKLTLGEHIQILDPQTLHYK